MTARIASCCCGALSLSCEGEQVRATGNNSRYLRTADSGNTVTYHFCPDCGSTVYWELSGYPDLVAVASGIFADPQFPPPRVSVWERTRHPWTERIADCNMQHES